MSAWCHGAPGIALARIASRGSMDDEVMQCEIDKALAITLQHALGGPDFVCCGVSGIIQILCTAGTVLRRDDLHERSTLLALDTVSRSKIKNGYELGLRSAGQLECASLFQGVAGIGYTLLRVARPDLVPEPLLLQ